MYRKTFVEINLDNLKNNVKNIIKKYPDYKYYIGMVKSNAYNHGYYIVDTLISSGINYLAVSSLEIIDLFAVLVTSKYFSQYWLITIALNGYSLFRTILINLLKSEEYNDIRQSTQIDRILNMKLTIEK